MNNPRFITLANYTEEKPVIPPPPTVTPAISVSPLSEIKFPHITEKKLYYKGHEEGLERMSKITDIRALINPDKGNIYSVVSNRYQMIPYKTTLEMVEEAIQTTPEFGNYQRSVRFTKDGGRMVAKYRFIDHMIPIGSNKDMVNPEIHVRRSYDTTWGFVLLLGAFMLVCSNGLVVGEKVLEYKHKHTLGVNQAELLESLNGSMDKFSDQVKIWEHWLDRMTTPDDYERIMNTMEFGERHTRAIETEVEISSHVTIDSLRTKTLSYWMLFNIISQYITHRVVKNNQPNFTRQEFFYDRMRTAFRR